MAADPLDVWYSNVFPEPIVCWSCGHYLDERCHRGVEKGVPCCEGKRHQCNGYAFPGRPPPRRGGDGWLNDRQDRTPLQGHYSLVDGMVVYTHVRGFGQDRERIHVRVNERCGECGGIHMA